MNSYLISIIIPIYNMQLYLERCVNSVTSQTYKKLQIILVDDGSIDRSPTLCDEFAKKDNRIIVIHKENGGLSDARNSGLKIANGDFITFIDADDWYKEDAIEKMVEGIARGVEIISMNEKITYSINDITTEDGSNEEIINSNEFIRRICYRNMSCSVYTKLFSRELISNVAFRKNRLNEDFLFLSDLVLQKGIFQIKVLNYVGYFYYQRPGSITNSSNKTSMIDSIENCRELLEKSREYNIDLYEYFLYMGTYQSCSLIIVNPDSLFNEKNPYLSKAISFIQNNKKNIKRLHLSKREFIITRMVFVFPFFASRILKKMYEQKHNKGKKGQ